MARIKKAGHFYIYILRCTDGTLYTGLSKNLEKRLDQHNTGKGAKYTRSRRPVELVWWKEYRYFKHAFLAELRTKKLTRQQKEKLICKRK